MRQLIFLQILDNITYFYHILPECCKKESKLLLKSLLLPYDIASYVYCYSSSMTFRPSVIQKTRLAQPVI